jgi:phosphatidylinositol 4-kinase B
MGFEMSPFKLTPDYIAIIDDKFQLFTQLLKSAFLSLRRHAEEFCVLVDLLQTENKLPCFSLGESTVTALKTRLKMELKDPEAENWIDTLVERSKGSAWTRGYDLYQALVNGIRP